MDTARQACKESTWRQLHGVESAEVSYEAGTAVVTLSSDVAGRCTEERPLEDQDYTVKGIE